MRKHVPGMSSDTGGVKPMQLGTRLVSERERLLGMTPEERQYRAQWLRDQHLTKREPMYVEQYWRERTNPIRRFYRAPLDALFGPLQPTLGDSAPLLRTFAGKGIMAVIGLYAGYYYFKYHGNDWTKKGGWKLLKSRSNRFVGDSNYHDNLERASPSDYCNRDFKNSPL